MTETTETRRKNRTRITAVITMIVAVMISVIFLQYFLCIPTGFDENRVVMLHKEPENSVDVLLIGSSATYAGFASAYAYEKYGFTSYPYALGGATCTMWKPALMDALRTQQPKLVVVDVFGGGYDHELISSRKNQVYTIMTHYPLSAEKVALAKELSGNIERTSAASLLFPILQYHLNMVPNLRNIRTRIRAEAYGPSPMKGFETRPRTHKLAPIHESAFSSQAEELDSDAERIIRDFIDYCKTNDIQVLFVKYPLVLKRNEPEEIHVSFRANRILEIAEENGFPVLNMQKGFREIGLNEKEDFYNHGHPNVKGQQKITDYLGRYLQEEMEIGPSELNTEERDNWDKSVRYYHALVGLAEEMEEHEEDVDIGESLETIDRLEKYMRDNDI